jgi:hypothetical protein
MQEYGEELDSKEMLLALFTYIKPEEICPPSQEEELTPTQLASPSPTQSKRVKRDSCPSCSSLSNESIQPQIYDVCHGPYNMYDCTAKIERLGFEGEELYDAIEMFINNLQRRQAFMQLPDPKAFDYVSRLLKKPK